MSSSSTEKQEMSILISGWLSKKISLNLARSAHTHSPEELLVKFKGHEGVRKVTQPLFQDTRDHMDVVVV